MPTESTYIHLRYIFKMAYNVCKKALIWIRNISVSIVILYLSVILCAEYFIQF